MIRRVSLFLLCLVALTTLTSCGLSLDPITQLDRIAELPLWQKLVAIGLSSLISEDLACIAAGMLASEGVLTFGWALTGAFLGIYLGDIPLYLMGRIGGITLLRRRPFCWFIKEDNIRLAESLFREHGGKLIFSSRLLPGSRLPTYAAAGVLRYPFWKFALYMFLAGGLSAIVLVWGSMRLGEVVFQWLKIYESYVFPTFLIVVFLVWVTVKLLEILATKRSRLVFLARCRKIYYRFRKKPARS
ncbi:MAG: DedA family protein [Verrucomicrobiales bacterium]|jgi:membrane protein DedA with SNARE-associated domain|nr:DedA family protein [Verrucomicrobiales bacterium]